MIKLKILGREDFIQLLTTLLEDILFDVPDKIPESAIEISGALVNEKLDKIVKNRDLSKYIL